MKYEYRPTRQQWLKDHPPCTQCGARGAHYCVGKKLDWSHREGDCPICGKDDSEGHTCLAND